MPRYFFNVTNEGQGLTDDVGSDLADLDEARHEALATLGDISKGKLEEDGDQRFVIEVREGDGPPLFRVSLILTLEELVN